jgi:hypothetical protein
MMFLGFTNSPLDTNDLIKMVGGTISKCRELIKVKGGFA